LEKNLKLEILFGTPTLEDMKEKIGVHFNQEMRIHREKLSIFEQYQVRPVERFIPEIWKYRLEVSYSLQRWKILLWNNMIK
jgi:hypothetical protein